VSWKSSIKEISVFGKAYSKYQNLHTNQKQAGIQFNGIYIYKYLMQEKMA